MNPQKKIEEQFQNDQATSSQALGGHYLRGKKTFLKINTRLNYRQERSKYEGPLPNRAS